MGPLYSGRSRPNCPVAPPPLWVVLIEAILWDMGHPIWFSLAVVISWAEKKQNSKQNCFLLCGRRRLRGRHALTSLYSCAYRPCLYSCACRPSLYSCACRPCLYIQARTDFERRNHFLALQLPWLFCSRENNLIIHLIIWTIHFDVALSAAGLSLSIPHSLLAASLQNSIYQ
jgi:hypothetical protein